MSSSHENLVDDNMYRDILQVLAVCLPYCSIEGRPSVCQPNTRYTDLMNPFMHNLRSFAFAICFLVFGALVAYGFGGLGKVVIVLLLAALEVTLSFENAVVNATVLRRLSVFWQRMFLTVGILIAVIGMRVVVPLLVVSLTSSLPLRKVIDLALYHPRQYGVHISAAHPAIAAFGGIFLLMVFLDFVIDRTKSVHWIGVVEGPLVNVARVKIVPVTGALVALGAAIAWTTTDRAGVLIGGLMGLGVYLAIQLLSWASGALGSASRARGVQVRGLAAFGLFCYLEVIDASFSFDGVIAAFAITTNIFDIALGLAIGAMFVRELTVWLVRRDTLSELIYIEHGGYYAIAALALMLGISLRFPVPAAVRPHPR